VRRRSIVREPLFEDSLAALIRDPESADDYTAAAEDLLSREPESGRPFQGGVWMLPMSPIRGKTVYLYYTFDDETVTFIAIAAFDA
jgi:hypothetical protein